MYVKILKVLLPIIISLIAVCGAGLFAYNLGKAKCETEQKETTAQTYKQETEHIQTVAEEVSSVDYSVITNRLLSKYCRQPCN